MNEYGTACEICQIIKNDKQTTQSQTVIIQSASVRWSRALSFQWHTAVTYFRCREKVTPNILY